MCVWLLSMTTFFVGSVHWKQICILSVSRNFIIILVMVVLYAVVLLYLETVYLLSTFLISGYQYRYCCSNRGSIITNTGTSGSLWWNEWCNSLKHVSLWFNLYYYMGCCNLFSSWTIVYQSIHEYFEHDFYSIFSRSSSWLKFMIFYFWNPMSICTLWISSLYSFEPCPTTPQTVNCPVYNPKLLRITRDGITLP